MKRKIHITVTALFLAMIFGLGTAFWVIPDTDFSPEENKPLQTLPPFTVQSWLDGKISAQLINYFSDQFPARNGWLNLHAMGELGLLRGEVNGVLEGKKWMYVPSTAADCCEDTAAVEAFDASFPPKEKKWMPSQEEFYIYSHSSVVR